MTAPPTLVAGRYRLVRMLGAGGMGVVWQAWDERLERAVALKMLRTQPELTDSERQQATDRAMREARITAGLHHPHAVTVFDVTEHEGAPCIVMQLIESTPLSVLLSEHGPLTPSVVAGIGAQVASALAAAHQLRIVHRDVKPANILIAGDGSARLSDFGISHALGDATITATGIIHGTPAYLAPEVARGGDTSFASDVFSLGATLYAALEGEPPFGTDRNAIALLHRVARGGYPAPRHAGPLAPLLREMLAPDPKRRPRMPAVAESLAALRSQLGSEPVPGTVPPPPPPAVPSVAARHPSPPAVTAAATAALTRPLPDATADTLRVDRPTRFEPSTAETEPLRPPVAAPDVEGPHPPPRARRRWALPVAGAAILIALLIAGVLLIGQWGPGAGGTANPVDTPAVSSTPDSATPSPESAAPSPDPTPEPAPTTAPSAEPPAATPEQRAIETVTSYYALLPGDVEAAWPLMTADYQQNHAGGREAYGAFWSRVSQVEIADVSATAADRAQATLTYHFTDGRVVQEVTCYRLVDEGGVLKIAATDVLSSVRL